MQADSIVPEGVQGYDRFAYTSNNPLRYTDPTGHYCLDEFEARGTARANLCPTANQIVEKHTRHGNRQPWSLLRQADKDAWSEAGYTANMWNETVYGNAHDVAGTLQDPAVYVAGAAGCMLTGLCEAVGLVARPVLTVAGWNALRVCSSVSICLRIAIALGIFYPPNNGFASGPTPVTLDAHQIITRYRSSTGQFASPIGTSPAARALLPQAAGAPITGYEVVNPIEVLAGPARAWFGQPGGGLQYMFARSIEYYVLRGDLIELP